MRSSRAFPLRLWLRCCKPFRTFPAKTFELSDFRISEIRENSRKRLWPPRRKSRNSRLPNFRLFLWKLLNFQRWANADARFCLTLRPMLGLVASTHFVVLFCVNSEAPKRHRSRRRARKAGMRSHRVCSAGLALLAQRLLGCRFLSKWAHRLISVARLACLARRSRRLRDGLLPARKVCLITRARGPESPLTCTIRLG